MITWWKRVELDLFISIDLYRRGESIERDRIVPPLVTFKRKTGENVINRGFLPSLVTFLSRDIASHDISTRARMENKIEGEKRETRKREKKTLNRPQPLRKRGV